MVGAAAQLEARFVAWGDRGGQVFRHDLVLRRSPDLILVTDVVEWTVLGETSGVTRSGSFRPPPLCSPSPLSTSLDSGSHPDTYASTHVSMSGAPRTAGGPSTADDEPVRTAALVPRTKGSDVI